MTNYKFSHKRIVQALGLLALSLVMLVGSAEYGQTQEQSQATLTFETATDRNGSVNVQIPIPGNVSLFVRFMVNLSTTPHSLLMNTLIGIEIVGKPGVEKIEHFERIRFSAGSGFLFADLPMSAFKVESSVAANQEEKDRAKGRFTSMSTQQGGTTVSPNNSQQKVGLEAVCRVDAVRGDVQIKRAGTDKWEPLTKDSVVRKGDEIKSGPRSGAVLKCGENIIVRVHASDSLTLTDAYFDPERVRTEFRLDRAAVFIMTEEEKQRESKVMTPHATATVRGSLFKVDHDLAQAGLSEIIVVKGIAEIKTLPTGKNKMTITGPGSCDEGGIRVTIDKDENISQPELVPIDREEWTFESEDGSQKIDFCAEG